VADHLREPMELDQLPDGRILLVERHGYLNVFDPATAQLSVVAKLNVYSEMGDGLMGIAVDPEYERTHRIFLYYSSMQDSMNQLSQFVFYDDSLHRSTEKMILNVHTGRTNCFHAAGSLAFGPDGYLYLSTGDNTSPFASDGYAPMDEQPGRKSFDAQRSAGNTMDLRGKILRIRVADDGTYTCPPDNLFSQDKKGRPEIYVMGCRNPFRISIDQRRNLLYWGDIGPDAGKTDTLHGPMGHDEINQARQAGNYGWPYFNGNNQAYRAFDFATKKPGAWFDPQHPVNRSVNNTGATELPPAQLPFIWYPYSRNRDFPMLGEGGRNAMAGPTYYCDNYAEKTRFPDYYNGKTIIYDWMRNWLMAVTVDSSGNFYHLEPMADSVHMTRPMDMIVDRKTGSIWMLEYGQRWYASNEDARLSRIDFVQGNRKPIARLSANKTAGGTPLSIRFDPGKSEDYDHDNLKFEYSFAGTVMKKTSRPDTLVWQFDQPGVYNVVLKITDPEGAWSADTVRIFAGNEPPTVQFSLENHNRSFYRPGDVLNYSIQVKDPEDGSIETGRISPQQVQTSADYLEKSVNPGKLPKKAEERTEAYTRGKLLIAGSDCYSCHAVDRQVNGPAFEAVAARYRNNVDFAVATVYRKIIYGGSGNWGNHPMSAHPNIREEDAIEMARWILALGDPPKPQQSLPLSGVFALPAEKGAYLLQASYRDRGKNGLPALSTETVLVLRPFLFQAENCDDRSRGVGNYKPFDNDTTTLNELKHNAWFAINQVDLSNIRSLTLRLGSGDSRNTYCGGRLEIHTGKPTGPLLAKVDISAANEKRMVFRYVEIPFNTPAPAGYCTLYFVFKNEANQGQGVVGLDWLRFNW
jgi:cytochrome c